MQTSIITKMQSKRPSRVLNAVIRTMSFAEYEYGKANKMTSTRKVGTMNIAVVIKYAHLRPRLVSAQENAPAKQSK